MPTITNALNTLYQQQHLTAEQSQRVFSHILQGNVSDIHLSALLSALKIKGEHQGEIAGAAHALRDHALEFSTSASQLVDSCGTGGDGANTINISTTAALVAASCGLNVVKHGNRSVSSNSGSADLLAALGINIELTPAQGAKLLEQTGFTFLFAPLYHQGVKHAMPVRNTLKTRTIFNILGPLINPARPQYQLLGVYSPELCLPMAKTLQSLGVKRAMVVHGSGTDEIALHGTTHVAELNGEQITQYQLSAEDFDLPYAPLSALAGQSPQYNAQISRAILQGKGSVAQQNAIIANVAALLFLTNKQPCLKSASKQVKSVLSSGQAYAKLQHIIQLSNKLGHKASNKKNNEVSHG